KFHEPAALDAFYRLANRPEVTHQAVLEPHRRRTLRLIGAATDPILLIHDTTELDYTSITSLEGLGQIGNGHGRGYECHNTLAVHAPTRAVIRLAGQILHRPDRAPEGETPRGRLRAPPPRRRRPRRRGAGRGGGGGGPGPPAAAPGGTSGMGVPTSASIANMGIQKGGCGGGAPRVPASAWRPTARAGGGGASCTRTRGRWSRWGPATWRSR